MTDYFAHSGNAFGHWHLLKDHLASVSELAGSYTVGWKGEEEAKLAGLLHDLGKYGDRFQNRLRGADRGLDHWSQGAYLAIKNSKAIAAAVAIQGHHIGLQSLQKPDLQKLAPEILKTHHPQALALSEYNPVVLEQRLNEDQLSVTRPQQRLFDSLLGSDEARIDNMLDVRRLFSALVDADFIDTEAHFNGDNHGKIPRRPGLKLNDNGLAQQVLQTLSDYLHLQSSKPSFDNTLQIIRQQLSQDCLKQAEQNTGNFTLTAPTGSGKTLSMLRFALQHAIQHKLERIILVVPYLSIIEQTADIYRRLFAGFEEDLILEHHSMTGLGEEQNQCDADGQDDRQRLIKRQRLLAENWDAPIIITTSVQFLESLFSNRPSACRKIHRLAHAVILFDEVQTLPTSLAIPTLAALSHIANQWHSSVVFATATQPAFNHLHSSVMEHCRNGWQPREIVADSAAMMQQTRRVEFTWLAEKPDWAQLAERIEQHEQILCIVNLKSHAHELWQHLADANDCFHLSTNQCPLHRQNVLQQVRQRLADGRSCRLIATQCIEAGVDIDFPVVYRALAPLDAIIQAAGRCNREGRQQTGQTVVFTPNTDKLYPDHGYRQAALVTESLKQELGDRFDLYDPATIQRYYRRLYAVADPAQQAPALYQAIRELNFAETARHYRLIHNDSINILTPYDPERFAELKALAEHEGLTRAWIKQARSLSISLFRPKPEDAVWDSLLPVQSFKNGRTQPGEDWFIVANPGDYDDILGYRKPDTLNCWIA